MTPTFGWAPSTGYRRQAPTPPAPAPAPRPAPTLQLLGPIRLTGPALGPVRAERSLLEVLAWLIEHPGSTPLQMSRDLLVAESTRRSNLSRLRVWLGAAPDGCLYLPEAYDGRLRVHHDLTTDWRCFRGLVAGGVKTADSGYLISALSLVRGRPLADAPAQQWGWAEPLRFEMGRLVRSAALELAERASAANDCELARWALGRGLAALPHDERLLVEQIRVERESGDDWEVKRLTNALRHAVGQGAKFGSDTVELLLGLARPFDWWAPAECLPLW